MKVHQSSNQFYEKNVYDLVEHYATKDKPSYDHIPSSSFNCIWYSTDMSNNKIK